mmetsp:Transcript_26457/g.67181  ORF Transcript_26457/g.67181 Transcript_26457/m.67181 type:complete len:137 (+) Transcript_26457:818-1228(+)
MSLDAYNLERLERACAEMRGEEAPSTQAQGERGRTARAARSQTEADGTLPMASLETNEKHPLVEREKAVAMGYTPTLKNFCMYKHCPWASQNKKQKCGEKSQGKQEGRARAQLFCTHPKCKCGYHAICYSFAHHLP